MCSNTGHSTEVLTSGIVLVRAGTKLLTYQADVYSDPVADLNCRLVFCYGHALDSRRHQTESYLTKEIKRRLGVASHRRACCRAAGRESVFHPSSGSTEGLVAVFDAEAPANRIVLSLLSNTVSIEIPQRHRPTP